MAKITFIGDFFAIPLSGKRSLIFGYNAVLYLQFIKR